MIRTAARRTIALGALAALAVLLAPGSALAQGPTGRIVGVTAENGQLQVVFETRGLPEGVSVDPDSVQVKLDTTELDPDAEPIGQTKPVDRSVMLALDASESMADDIDEAKAAAETFLDTVPADVKVGLVTFAKKATLAVKPTTQRDEVRDQVRQIDTSVGTALYDGIQLAVDNLGEDGVRSIVLLSDGDDTTSTADLPSTVEDLGASGVDLDAVAFDQGDTQVLGELTAAGTGRLVQTADRTDLESLFEESAEAIAGQVLITAPLPATIQAGDFNVAVEATAGAAVLADSVVGFVTEAGLPPVPKAGPAPVNPTAGFFDSDPALLAGGMLLFAGLAVIAGFGFA
ncbi:MAG TPA: vWA domain-containing protein, partial [Actinomycetes bacterium]|nr:vWA domain-containing protein [Actinomycetes bacterium]